MTAARPLPGRTLRIGVTGTRDRADADRPHVKDQVTDLLRRIALARGPNDSKPRLQLLSPLAEGADRLVARCALDEHYELVCPLPFPQPVYERDFAEADGSRSEFHTLLAHAGDNILALDGARDDPGKGIYAETRSYEAVGRLIVRNCDLIVGIWDGLPGKGRGGTADTIHYAARFGPPVVWIDTTRDTPPRWIEEEHDLRHNALPRGIEQPLELYFKRLLHPPEAHDRGYDHGLLHCIGYVLGRLIDKLSSLMGHPPPESHLTAFLNEKPNPAGGLWLFHTWLMQVMAGGQKAPWTPPRTPQDQTARRWFEHYQPADDRAGECARRYRSSYVWVFVLGALALSAAAFSLGFAEDHLLGKLIFTTLEFIVLLLIAGLVIFDGKLGWQRRSIEYRLLAELCRKQQTLASLAWVVPRASAWADTAPDQEPEPNAPHTEPISWVAWLFSAWLRDTALPTGTIDPLRVEHARDAAQRDLLNEQIDYHTARRTQTYRAARRLAFSGEIAFFAVLIVVLGKLALLSFHLEAPDTAPHGWLHILGLAGAILPAISAMLVGIRAYAELEILAEQSDAMLKALKHAKARIDELDPNEPLASQTLGVALAAVATLMLEDLEGWARLFRGKILDA
jgi:hypothetical protein